jgi:hypothetical protein
MFLNLLHHWLRRRAETEDLAPDPRPQEPGPAGREDEKDRPPTPEKPAAKGG